MREMRSEANVSYKRCFLGGGGAKKKVHVKGEGEKMKTGKRKENTSKTRV